MAKRDDQKRKERELDLNMRWGDSKDGKNRDRVRDRGRSRSRSEERRPGLYAPLRRDTCVMVTLWVIFQRPLARLRLSFLESFMI